MRKFTLTAEDLEGIAPTLSAALPHPLSILFDDVTGPLEGGDHLTAWATATCER